MTHHVRSWLRRPSNYSYLEASAALEEEPIHREVRETLRSLEVHPCFTPNCKRELRQASIVIYIPYDSERDAVQKFFGEKCRWNYSRPQTTSMLFSACPEHVELLRLADWVINSERAVGWKADKLQASSRQRVVQELRALRAEELLLDSAV